MDRKIEVATLGKCNVDGVAVSNRRAVELATLLALSGGRSQRDWLAANLFERAPASSTLPTLALRARKLGLPVHYERGGGYYTLEDRLRFDVVELLGLLRENRVREALDMYTGPFLPTGNSPFVRELRANVENVIVRAVMGGEDLELMVRADRLVKHPELSEKLARQGQDPITVSLSRSWLAGLDVAD